mmetsp:Transcript_24632/g.59920  ORF Transcript_24632/g.59920 Transcript_24632/m.59920 type:complete len:238 (-) Transcript_24632:183-896(-)
MPPLRQRVDGNRRDQFPVEDGRHVVVAKCRALHWNIRQQVEPIASPEHAPDSKKSPPHVNRWFQAGHERLFPGHATDCCVKGHTDVRHQKRENAPRHKRIHQQVHQPHIADVGNATKVHEPARIGDPLVPVRCPVVRRHNTCTSRVHGVVEVQKGAEKGRRHRVLGIEGATGARSFPLVLHEGIAVPRERQKKKVQRKEKYVHKNRNCPSNRALDWRQGRATASNAIPMGYGVDAKN